MDCEKYRLMPAVVTANEMAEIDRYTIDSIGIPGMVLMENAGVCVVQEIKRLLDSVKDKNVLVLCGKGNNGGDGFVVSRHLRNMGTQVTTIVFGRKDKIKGDAKTNLDIYEKVGGEVLWETTPEHIGNLASIDLIVDALLGTGVQGPLKSPLDEIVHLINRAHCPVVAIDLPTGMHADTGQIYGECVNATVTVTMAHPKMGLLFYPGKKHAGDVVVADIGIPHHIVCEKDIKSFQITNDYVREMLPKRPQDTYKNKCGHVLLLAGSAGLTGAATLSSEAVLRAGAGMAVLGIPESLNVIMEQKLTEVMTLPLPETDEHTISVKALEQLGEKLQWAEVLAIGPGLSTHSETCKLVFELLQNEDKTIVLDADGINCFANNRERLRSSQSQIIITPHPGELARLFKCRASDISSNVIEYVTKAAAELNVTVVLKTAPTVIASPEGDVYINSTGNAGMATAGMGDVLTGVIAGLAAQGMRCLSAAISGVYLHGFAGDLAQRNLGEFGMIAGDVLKYVPEALKEIQQLS